MQGPQQRVGFTYRMIVAVLRPLLLVFTRRRWSGGERIPPVGTGVIVVANHVSHIDPLTFGQFVWDNGRAPRYLAKDSLFRIPLARRMLRAAGQIPVSRESDDAARSIRGAVEAVQQGECVAIYPEGTVTRDPDLWPMVGKSGAARIALETGCPVIPVAQWGPQNILAPYAKWARLLPPKTVEIRAGRPVDLDDLRAEPMSAEIVRQATERIIAAITDQLAEIREATPPQERFDPRKAGVPTTGNPRKKRRNTP